MLDNSAYAPGGILLGKMQERPSRSNHAMEVKPPPCLTLSCSFFMSPLCDQTGSSHVRERVGALPSHVVTLLLPCTKYSVPTIISDV